MFYNIYFSPTDGTKRVADILVCNLDGDFLNVDLCCDINSTELNKGDVYLISTLSY